MIFSSFLIVLLSIFFVGHTLKNSGSFGAWYVSFCGQCSVCQSVVEEYWKTNDNQ